MDKLSPKAIELLEELANDGESIPSPETVQYLADNMHYVKGDAAKTEPQKFADPRQTEVLTRESLDIINELVAQQVPMPQVINNQNLKAAKSIFDRSRTSRNGGIPPNSAAAEIQK